MTISATVGALYQPRIGGGTESRADFRWIPSVWSSFGPAGPLIRSRPGVGEDAARLADALGPAARRDLLRVLTSSSEVRADVIRQLHERPDGQEMADLLIFLVAWEGWGP
jgi:hypothetical protein